MEGILKKHDKSIMNTIIDLVDQIRKEYVGSKPTDSITSNIIQEHIGDADEKINLKIYNLCDLDSIYVDIIKSVSN